MIGLVLVTHCNLAEEFKAALEHVVGPQEAVETINIGPNDNMEDRRNDVMEAARRVNSGSGVIILTDLFGGTPSNLSISLMKENEVEVIAGINLPMLVKLASLRDSSNLVEAAETAQDAGRKYIHVASKVLQSGT